MELAIDEWDFPCGLRLILTTVSSRFLMIKDEGGTRNSSLDGKAPHVLVTNYRLSRVKNNEAGGELRIQNLRGLFQES